MKPHQNNSGFTFVDLMLVIGCLVIVGFFVLPRMARTRCYGHRINCTNNLKQVSLAFRIWAGDNNDKMPMQVSVTNGGAMEAVMDGNYTAVFQVMSNELNTPKILFCPDEKNPKRQAAVVFGASASPEVKVFIAAINLSYFVGLDAEDTKPQTILAGDDHFTVAGLKPKPGLFALSTNAVVEWRNERHPKQGNIALADGSVQRYSTREFRKTLIQTGLATNRLAMP